MNGFSNILPNKNQSNGKQDQVIHNITVNTHEATKFSRVFEFKVLGKPPSANNMPTDKSFMPNPLFKELIVKIVIQKSKHGKPKLR